ncbi:hypothetical protein D3C86_1419700 [compost metagenome]
MQHRLYSPERNYILHAYYILFEGCKCTKNSKVTGSYLNSTSTTTIIKEQRFDKSLFLYYGSHFVLQTTNRTPIDP